MADERPTLLTVEEAAVRLSVSRQTIRLWINKGAMAAVYVGPFRRVRIPEGEVVKQITPRPHHA